MSWVVRAPDRKLSQAEKERHAAEQDGAIPRWDQRLLARARLGHEGRRHRSPSVGDRRQASLEYLSKDRAPSQGSPVIPRGSPGSRELHARCRPPAEEPAASSLSDDSRLRSQLELLPSPGLVRQPEVPPRVLNPKRSDRPTRKSRSRSGPPFLRPAVWQTGYVPEKRK